MTALTIAIAGNPNCGKTTLLNGLTGARQRVGNWPGVTVERKEGTYRTAGQSVRVVDLPGVYSLSTGPGSESLDEKLARDFIRGGEAQVVVDVVDATNLERNLYLTAQLVESGRPMVLALNMMDRARARGTEIDAELLARRLGCPVVPMVAARGAGLDRLKAAVRQVSAAARAPTATIEYAPGLEQVIAELTPLLASAAAAENVAARWLTLRALEGHDSGPGASAELPDQAIAHRVAAAAAALRDDPDILIADGRFAFANELAAAVARQAGRARRGASDAIDSIVLNRWLGPAIFLGLMYLMFMFTINLGGALVDFFELTAGLIFVDGPGALLNAAGSPQWLVVVLVGGFGGGLQVVATFVPIIGFLYLFLSLLEDSGYMARAAFLMDRLMRVVGLPGRSVVPLIVGFGCNVPAIMASRTLERERDRIMTVVMTPFMSCGARLTIYALFATAFFPVGGQNVVFALYLVGIGAAIATGLMLKHTLLRGETVPFVMELPPYCRPRARDVLLHAWVRLKGFVFGAGKVIVLVVVVLNFLNSLGSDGSFGNEDSETSALSAAGRALVPVFEPLGIRRDNWPATVGLFTGVFAKEAVVGTLDALYSGLARDHAAAAGDGSGSQDGSFDFRARIGAALATLPVNLAAVADLVADPLGLEAVRFQSFEAAAARQEVALGTFRAMASRFDGAVGAFSYLLFILLYIPCVAALGAVNREVGPAWTAFSALWSTGVAYAVAVTVYQGATFAQHPVSSVAWIGAVSAFMAATIAGLGIAGRVRSVHPAAAAE